MLAAVSLQFCLYSDFDWGKAKVNLQWIDKLEIQSVLRNALMKNLS